MMNTETYETPLDEHTSLTNPSSVSITSTHTFTQIVEKKRKNKQEYILSLASDQAQIL